MWHEVSTKPLEHAEYARHEPEAPYGTFEQGDTTEQVAPDVLGDRSGLGKGGNGLAIGLIDIFSLFGDGGFQSLPSGGNLFKSKPL